MGELRARATAVLLLAAAPCCAGFTAIARHSAPVISAKCPHPPAIRAAEYVAGPRTAALPPPEDLSDEVMLSIIYQETSDQEVNDLVWKYLGYRYDDAKKEWDTSAVFPNWAKNFPTPPDLIGVTRTYTREVDEPVLRAVQSLQRSVPKEHKNNLRAYLKPLGWNGYKMEAPAHAKATAGLTPNMTRRAQVCNWLLYYREALHGVSIEELRKRREAKAVEEAKAEAAAAARGESIAPTGTTKQSVV